MHAFSYTWSLQVRDKDGSHTIRCAVAENPVLRANFTALVFYRSEVTLQEYGFFYHFYSCDLDLDPMIFI